MKSKKLKLTTAMLACLASSVVLADMTPPPQAQPPVKPQERPESQSPATGVVVEMREAKEDEASKPAQAIADKTRNEIYAMLADIVNKSQNLVIIDHKIVSDDKKPALQSDQLAVADQPNGHFRVYTEISAKLKKGKAIVNLQILKAGHSGDKQDMVKPIAEKMIEVDPKNVRKSDKEVIKFFKSELHMADEVGDAQEAMKRPSLSMWTEIKNKDGSEGVKNGSSLVVYYKPDSDLYVNLYYVSSDNKINRLVPSESHKNNFVKKGQIYRYPETGEGVVVSGKGTDKIRIIYTRIPSGADRNLGLKNGLVAKQDPIGVIPTQYPAVFATSDLSKFFSLPEQIYNEYEISYEIK